MKIGLAQMNSQNNKDTNLASAENLIDRLAQQGAALVMLPEHFNWMGAEQDKPDNAEELTDSPSLARIRGKAMQHGIHIHCGSFPQRDGKLIYNTGVIFDPQGEIQASYRKIHLFDVEIPGGRKYLESKTIMAGSEIVTFTIGEITFGMATCYDLRFPELFRKLSGLGAQVILLPAAFTLMTGRDHWQLLLRARAVENLCYVAAAGQYGSCPPGHLSYGRSMVVDPWGVVVAQAGDGVTTVVTDLDMSKLAEIRTSFPALEHVRRDIFG